MSARKRRGPKHPGVTLVPPEKGRPNVSWRARFVDPDSGKTEKPSLPRELTTLEQREAWAVAKSRELTKRKLDLAAGATRITSTALADAVNAYHEAASDRLRESTAE